MRTEEYAYDGDVLTALTFYSETHQISGYYTFVFSNGKKLTANCYSSSQLLRERIEFQYDSATGKRSGSTSYDASGAVTGSTARSYEGGLFTETRTEQVGKATTVRRFSYEEGPLGFDPDVYFEF
jgi:hypothetical protein